MFRRFGIFVLIATAFFTSACGRKQSSEIKNQDGYSAAHVADTEKELLRLGIRFTPVEQQGAQAVANPAAATGTGQYGIDYLYYNQHGGDGVSGQDLVGRYIQVLQTEISNPAVSAQQKNIFKKKLDAAGQFLDMLIYGIDE